MSIKVEGGWTMDREIFSDDAKKVLAVAINHRRALLQLPGDALRGMRFNDDGAILARLESMFTEAEFMACPGLRIDGALRDAAQSDYWYEHEKRYDCDYGESGETEIADDD